MIQDDSCVTVEPFHAQCTRPHLAPSDGYIVGACLVLMLLVGLAIGRHAQRRAK